MSFETHEPEVKKPAPLQELEVAYAIACRERERVERELSRVVTKCIELRGEIETRRTADRRRR